MQKLALTDQQIDEICQALPVNRALPESVGKSIIFQVRMRLAQHLLGVRLYPCLFPRFKSEVVHAYWKTRSDSGTAVGIQASTSLGERQTQSTLNTFHAAGISVKTVVVGVPRFSQLLNATKCPKMVNCLIYLNDSFDSISHVRSRIGNLFTEMRFRRLVKEYRVIKNTPFEEWHHLYARLFDVEMHQLHPDSWRIRFVLDADVLFEYQISLKMIRDALQLAYCDCSVMHLPDAEATVDVFLHRDVFAEVETQTNALPKEESNVSAPSGCHEDDDDKEEIDENDMEADPVESIDPLDEEDVLSMEEADDKVLPFVPVEEVIEWMAQEDEEEIPADVHCVNFVEDKIIPTLLQVRVSGVEHIRDIFFEKRHDEWLVATEGSNLYGLFAHPIVNKTRTICNNMWEIFQVFGIEAARQFLIEEYMDVVSSDGSFVNSSHVELLVDVMVYTGSIIAISRYGLKKVSCGPLAKASFEESVDNFLRAGVHGETESTNSVSASIMLGKPPKTGTGVFDLLLNVEQLTKPLPASVATSSVVLESSSSSEAASASSSFADKLVAMPEPVKVRSEENHLAPRSDFQPKKASAFFAKKKATTEFTKKNSFFDD